MKQLSSPTDLIKKFPTPSYVSTARSIAIDILEKKDPRKIIFVGPCSVHDPISALDFARRLKGLSLEVKKTLFPIMRLFVEKPRSRLGWKGLLYDPSLDGSNDLELGLNLSRKLLVEIGEMGVPCSMEFLDPLASFYLKDTITWGLVGARTSASQPHRQMASDLPFPVGFKNDVEGCVDIAIDSIISARHPHSYLGIDQSGQIAALQAGGNRWTHLVLRGSRKKSNYDPGSIEKATQLLKQNGIDPVIVVDCSHGNSQKLAKEQVKSFTSVIEQIVEGNKNIVGLMLESHIFEGKQPLTKNLAYGVSVTDSCLGWDETEALLLWADGSLSGSSIPIHSVQN